MMETATGRVATKDNSRHGEFSYKRQDETIDTNVNDIRVNDCNMCSVLESGQWSTKT